MPVAYGHSDSVNYYHPAGLGVVGEPGECSSGRRAGIGYAVGLGKEIVF